MNADPRYADINGYTWPRTTANITTPRAVQLVRRFGRKSLASANVEHDMHVPAYVLRGRRCWGGPGGWPRMIHDVSHAVFRYRHPGFRPHAGGHETLEREIMLHVLSQGWALKPTPRAKPDPLLKARDAVKKWERRAKLAATKLKKYRATVRRHERKQELPA